VKKKGAVRSLPSVREVEEVGGIQVRRRKGAESVTGQGLALPEA
jgi:hypothetical protein